MFRKAGKVWFGDAREPSVTIEWLLWKWSIRSNLPAFLDPYDIKNSLANLFPVTMSELVIFHIKISVTANVCIYENRPSKMKLF